MPDNSFDIVSKVELPEVVNAVQQAVKEIQTRYDLKSTKSSIELDSDALKLTIRAPDEFVLKQVGEVLDQKLIRRKVPLKNMQRGEPQPAAGQSVVQEVSLQQGIPTDTAREIVKIIKQLKLKVQAAIQGDQVRVSGKKRDELQTVIAQLKERELGIELQFVNYRG
jgi:hypothetical protein